MSVKTDLMWKIFKKNSIGIFIKNLKTLSRKYDIRKVEVMKADIAASNCKEAAGPLTEMILKSNTKLRILDLK